MIYPSIDKILLKVDSKYKLIHIASKRSKEMNQKKNFQLKESEYKSKKSIGRALEEINEGLININ